MKVVYSNEVTNVSKADHHGVVSWGSMSFEGQCLGHLPIKVKGQGHLKIKVKAFELHSQGVKYTWPNSWVWLV